MLALTNLIWSTQIQLLATSSKIRYLRSFSFTINVVAKLIFCFLYHTFPAYINLFALFHFGFFLVHKLTLMVIDFDTSMSGQNSYIYHKIWKKRQEACCLIKTSTNQHSRVSWKFPNVKNIKRELTRAVYTCNEPAEIFQSFPGNIMAWPLDFVL